MLVRKQLVDELWEKERYLLREVVYLYVRSFRQLNNGTDRCHLLQEDRNEEAGSSLSKNNLLAIHLRTMVRRDMVQG
jgi:hypothetical protein